MDNQLPKPLQEAIDYLAARIADHIKEGTELEGSGKNVTPGEDTESKKYVYGIRGIRSRYGVGHNTASSWVAGMLAPAVIRVNRNIILNTEKADKILEQWTQEQRQQKQRAAR